jgi:hypothetical protein
MLITTTTAAAAAAAAAADDDDDDDLFGKNLLLNEYIWILATLNFLGIASKLCTISMFVIVDL